MPLARRQSLDEPAADLAHQHVARAIARLAVKRSPARRPARRRPAAAASPQSRRRTNHESSDVRTGSQTVQRQRHHHVTPGAARGLDHRAEDRRGSRGPSPDQFRRRRSAQIQLPRDLLKLVRRPRVQPRASSQRAFRIRARSHRERVARRRQHQVAQPRRRSPERRTVNRRSALPTTPPGSRTTQRMMYSPAGRSNATRQGRDAGRNPPSAQPAARCARCRWRHAAGAALAHEKHDVRAVVIARPGAGTCGRTGSSATRLTATRWSPGDAAGRHTSCMSTCQSLLSERCGEGGVDGATSIRGLGGGADRIARTRDRPRAGRAIRIFTRR